jgi:uncharacterized protein YdeI (YjbR/CyaY-like superfamily)
MSTRGGVIFVTIRRIMGTSANNRSPQVDAYIKKAAPFARPILVKLRSLFHRACPKVAEKIKWGHVSFEYQGMLGGMAAFKHHATWGMWKASLIQDPDGVMARRASSMMSAGQIDDVSQLADDDDILGIIKQGVVLNEQGAKVPSRARKTKRPPPKCPPELAAALKKSPKAAATYAQFNASHQREYVEWITEAKQQATRERRIAQAIEWMALGKPRNWKYMNC